MDNRVEVREFLVSRRAAVTPQQAGLPAGTDRRVPGLRRSEVAMLAGVSVEYYTKLERGVLSGVSDSVLEAIASALQLDEAERGHLFDLARAASGGSVARRRTRGSRALSLRPGLAAAVEAVTAGPAFVRNGRLDVLGTNLLGRAFYDDVYAMGDPVPNLARFCFLADSAHRFYPYWDAAADVTVAILRAEAGRDPYDRALTDLVGELSTRSEEFRVRWARHNVSGHGTGCKHAHHPVVGDLTLSYEALELPGDPGQTMLVYTAEPDSPSAEALRLLASWTSTPAVEVADVSEKPRPTR
ncbi:MAG: helix-turn-helix domain-containing protein [Propionibacteriaceae bacterium]|nr:helix-turn-helix domain-containing protein [Propionibacteriaceae bacterium]